MPDTSDVRVNLDLAFPQAGVVFDVEAGPDRSFRLTVRRVSDGAGVPFTSNACPQLADWVRGYTRWLRRARVTASHDESSITGLFDEGLTPEQVLEGVRDACDMIRQRFGLYKESVLA
jgi:hypothetical protein